MPLFNEKEKRTLPALTQYWRLYVPEQSSGQSDTEYAAELDTGELGVFVRDVLLYDLGSSPDRVERYPATWRDAWPRMLRDTAELQRAMYRLANAQIDDTDPDDADLKVINRIYAQNARSREIIRGGMPTWRQVVMESRPNGGDAVTEFLSGEYIELLPGGKNRAKLFRCPTCGIPAVRTTLKMRHCSPRCLRRSRIASYRARGAEKDRQLLDELNGVYR
jgi:hypothetical protein